MIRCSSCGLLNQSDARFCGGCGARMPTLHPFQPGVAAGNEATVMRAPSVIVPTQGRPGPEVQAAAVHAVAPPAPSVPAPAAVAQPSAHRPSGPVNQPQVARPLPSAPLSAPPSALPSGNVTVPSPLPARSTIPPASKNGVAASMTGARTSLAETSLNTSAAFPAKRRIGAFLIALLLFDVSIAAAGVLLLRSALKRSGEAPARENPTGSGSQGTTTEPQPIPAAPTAGSGSAASVEQRGEPQKLRNESVPASTATPSTATTGGGGGGGGSGSASAGSARPNSGSAAAADFANSLVPSPEGSASAASGSGGSSSTGSAKVQPVPGNKVKPGGGLLDPYNGGSGAAPANQPSDNTGAEQPIEPPMPTPSEATQEEVSISEQAARQQVRGRAKFDRCYSSATKATGEPLVGSLTIAFQVLPSGKVSGTTVTDNSTQSATLAKCVSAEVNRWTFTNVAATSDVVRVFRFGAQ